MDSATVEILKNTKLHNAFGLTFIGLLIALAYKTTFIWMYGRYISEDSYYSHGLIVPLITIYFIYSQKDRLSLAEQNFSLFGLCIVLFAIILHILGTILYIFSISGFSLFFLFIGLSLFLFGRKRTKVVWFPLIFLVFMFPIPMAVIELVSFPLKMLAANAGVWIVDQIGIPVHREGFNIFIPAGHLLVGNPCSGLRSLIAFLALGAIIAYLGPITKLKKLTLFLITIPIAMLSNIVRIPILIIVSHYQGLAAAAPDTFVHTGSGIMVFVIGFLMLLLTKKVLEWRT